MIFILDDIEALDSDFSDIDKDDPLDSNYSDNDVDEEEEERRLIDGDGSTIDN